MPKDDYLAKQKRGLEIAKTLPPNVILGLTQMGVDPFRFEDPNGAPPYTAAGTYNVNEYSVPQLVGKNITGLTTSDAKGQVGSTVLYAPDANASQTRAHEYEHALAKQGLGHGKAINKKFDELVADPASKALSSRYEVVDALLKHAPHLVEKWGLDPDDAKAGYFSQAMADRYPFTENLFNEQAATLSALEQQKGKRLVDDPYIRQNVLNTPAKREAYDAVTGLRQTRLDARDLPPYTRIPEDKSDTPKPKQSDWIDSVMKLISRR